MINAKMGHFNNETNSLHDKPFIKWVIFEVIDLELSARSKCRIFEVISFSMWFIFESIDAEEIHFRSHFFQSEPFFEMSHFSNWPFFEMAYSWSDRSSSDSYLEVTYFRSELFFEVSHFSKCPIVEIMDREVTDFLKSPPKRVIFLSDLFQNLYFRNRQSAMIHFRNDFLFESFFPAVHFPKWPFTEMIMT